MAKLNYGELIGKVVAVEYKEVSYEVVVVDTKMVAKTSKNGRNYKVRRLWVAFKGSKAQLEIGTQSWNKRSFMKNLLKVEATEPRFHFVGEKMFGDLATLIEWGKQCGLYQSYKQKYSYESMKAEFEIMHKRAIEENDFTNTIQYFEDFKVSLRRVMHEVIDFEDLGEVKGIEINKDNLQKYMKACMLDIEKYKLKDLADIMISSLQSYLLSYFDRFGSIPTYDKYGFSQCNTEREVKKLYKKLSKELHPDLGGNEKKFIAMNSTYKRVMKRFA